MSLLKQLSKSSGTIIYVQILEWIFDLPEFILSETEKARLLRVLFNAKITFSDLKCHYSIKQGILYIRANGCRFGIIPEENFGQIEQASEFYDKIIVLSRISENVESTDQIKFVNYRKVVDLLSQLTINDQRSQYLIDDYIEALLSITKH